MSIKIRISYQAPEELALIMKLLHPVASSCRVPKVQQGKFKKAYVTVAEQRANKEDEAGGKRENAVKTTCTPP